MKTRLLKIFLVINYIIFIFAACNNNYKLNSEYLDSKNCYYELNYSNDSLFLDYYLVFDTTTFSLANIDTSRVSLYQSAYFAWHANYISYRILREFGDFEKILVYWKSDTLLSRTLFTKSNARENLEKKFSNPLHYTFVRYLIDSIPVEDYFTMNNILFELYEIYEDPRLSWNYAHLINQFEKNQCGYEEEHVSFEIFMLLDIGIRVANLDESKINDLLRFNGYFINHCLPNRDSINEEFDKLNLYFSDE